MCVLVGASASTQPHSYAHAPTAPTHAVARAPGLRFTIVIHSSGLITPSPVMSSSAKVCVGGGWGGVGVGAWMREWGGEGVRASRACLRIRLPPTSSTPSHTHTHTQAHMRAHLVHDRVQRGLIQIDVWIVRHHGHQEALELRALDHAVALDVVDSKGDWGARGVCVRRGGVRALVGQQARRATGARGGAAAGRTGLELRRHCHSQRALASRGALGWKTERERTNSPNSITLFCLMSNNANTCRPGVRGWPGVRGRARGEGGAPA